MPSAPKISPKLEAALPVTFASFCFDQMKDWDLLFPAEHSYFERLFALLDRSDAASVERLFAPVVEIEQKMGANERTFPRGKFTLDQVDFLNRNPHYSEWRTAIAAVFAEIDPLLDAEMSRGGHARLVMVITPAELPAGSDRMWLRLGGRGSRIAIDAPEDVNEYLPLLLTGAAKARSAPNIAELFAAGPKGGAYTSWIVEAGTRVSQLGANSPLVVRYSYDSLDSYRKRLMDEVQKMLTAEHIAGPRQLSARLKEMKLLDSEGALARDPILAESVRAILLSGNGTLLIDNTFVEWATIQAIRRARPSVVLTSFGIRNKIKPFSSLLIYADQDATNPIPSQMDTLGTYVDLEVFYQYIFEEFEKYGEYRENTAYLFVGEGLDQMLVIGPPDVPLLQAGSNPLKLPAVFANLKDWLGV